MEEEDLYEVLSIERGATKVEIKKAYRKAALQNHPDKVAEEHRAEAEIRFKSVQAAYDILQDDQKRHLYDTHGMDAFKGPGAGGNSHEADMEDILAQMFGMRGGSGMPGGPGMGRRGPQKGPNEEQGYEVTLEELFKGKTTKFASTKNVVCGTCNGSGGKDKAKSLKCSNCGGKGQVVGLRHTPFGLMQEAAVCSNCEGTGSVFKDKDRCKKCKGKRVVQTKKMLELYIPRGSREGDKIVLQGEADQVPDQEPGDIIFELTETPHETFRRAGADLAADIHVTLVEALTGLNRVVVMHLDGRGIQLNTPKGQILRPGQILKVEGEGMFLRKSDARGNLFLEVTVDFPEDGELDDSAIEKLRNFLPGPEPAIKVDTVDEVDYDGNANMDDFGGNSDDPRGGAEWEDDEEEDGQPQCATQ